MLRQFIATQLQTDQNYRSTGWLFLKLLALIYFAAFASISVQITGLVGPDGILPFAQQLEFLLAGRSRPSRARGLKRVYGGRTTPASLTPCWRHYRIILGAAVSMAAFTHVLFCLSQYRSIFVTER